MIGRMGYMFIMLLTGLSIKMIVTLVKWIVAELGLQKQVEEKPLPGLTSHRVKGGSSVLFFIPLKLRTKLT